MADRSGTGAEIEALTESAAVLTPMGQFLGRPDLPLSRAVTTIGSRDTCRLQLDSRSISRVHALIVSTHQGAYVSDLCSRTGVLVNGRSVRDTNLVSGDRVQLGRFTFRFRGEGGPGGTVVNPSSPPLALQAEQEKRGDGSPIPIPGRAFLIGRRENADLPLVDDEAVSTAHAVLFQLDGRWFVRDLFSRTGTRVNNAAIDTQQRVRIGDTIQIGSSSWTLVPAAAPVSSDAPTDVDDPTALALDADLPPLADLEPIDFSSIDSIEAGGTPDDALPAEPAAATVPLEAEPGDAAELQDEPQFTPPDVEPFPLEPAAQSTAATDLGDVDALDWEIPESPAAVEPLPMDFIEPADAPFELATAPAAPVDQTSDILQTPTDALEPVGTPPAIEAAEEFQPPLASAPPDDLTEVPEPGPAGVSSTAETAEPTAEMVEPFADASEPLAEVSESSADQASIKPKRKRPARKNPAPKRGRPSRTAPGIAEAGAGLETAALAASASAALPEITPLASAAAAEGVEPAADSALAFEQALADEPPPAAFEQSLGKPPDEPAEEPASALAEPAGLPLELAALEEGEEFVAVPEPEIPDAPSDAAASALELPQAVADEFLESPPAADAPPAESLLADPSMTDASAAEPVEPSAAEPVEPSAAEPVEPSAAEDWLIEDAPAELPLTSANTASVTGEADAPRSISAALPEAGLLLDVDAATTTASSAGPGVFGFTFDGGSFLGGGPLGMAGDSPAAPIAEEPGPPASVAPEAEPEPEADVFSTSIAHERESEPATEVLSLDDFPDVPLEETVETVPRPVATAPLETPPAPVAAEIPPAPTPPPAPKAVPPTAPTPIPTLSDEVAVPPLATPARTPPRQRRPLTTAFDGLSGGAKVTGFVGGVSVNGRAPAARGGPSVDVFSQLAPAIGVDALLDNPAAFLADAPGAPPAVSRRPATPGAPAGARPAVPLAGPQTAAAALSPSSDQPPDDELPRSLSAVVPRQTEADAPPQAELPQPEYAAALVSPTARAGRSVKAKRRWPLWGLLGLMFVSLGAVWAGVYGLVAQASRITGTLSFANLTEQDVAAQQAFETDQIARLHSNEVRTIARSMLLAGGAPTGFTEDMLTLGRALDRDGSASFNGNTLTVAVRANDPVEGRSQTDALLVALAQRDKDLGDTQQRAAQGVIDANAAVATARDKLDALKAELLTMRARGEDRPDPEEMAALQANSDRAQRLLTLAGSTRLNAEAELDLLRQPLPLPVAAGVAAGVAAAGDSGGVNLPDSPRDAQLTRLRWELQDLGRQVSDLKSSRPTSPPPTVATAAPADGAAGGAAGGGTGGGTGGAGADPNESLLAYLDVQVQALSAALSDQATGIPGPAGEAVRLRQMETLSVRVHDLQQAEKTAQANAQLAVDQLRNVQGRLDSARQATVEIDQLIADIRAAETTLREKSDAATLAQQQASIAVSVAGDPSESVQPLEDRRPLYAGVLSGLLLCVFSALAINALRAGPEPTMVDAISGEEVEHQPIPPEAFPAAQPAEEAMEMQEAHAD